MTQTNVEDEMIADQAEKLRQMVQGQKKKAHVLAITSGKGGVGKSNIAANLSLCLLAARRNVLLIDADLGLANLDVVLGMKTRHNLSQVISGQRRLSEIVEQGPAGLRIICGASGLTQLADLNEFQRRHLIQEMGMLEEQSDTIIIDTGAGISKNVLNFCEAADHTLVVTTPEPTSITDAYAMIKCLSKSQAQNRISLLVNRVSGRAEAKKVYQRVSKVAGQFLGQPVYDAGFVLDDPRVSEAVCQREPVVLAFPRSQASFCLMALAGKLGRVQESSPHEIGFFRKVANWFF
jgi:flagellar biosynthesis protein FlhG